MKCGTALLPRKLVFFASVFYSLLIISACTQEEPVPTPQTGQSPVTVDPAAAAVVTTAHSRPLILVTGITGQQGGAVAMHLLERDFPVRGLTRDPARPEARAYADAGVEIVAGDFNDPASIEQAARGAHGLFLNSPGTVPNEAELGMSTIDAAIRAGVKHIVFTSYYSAHPGKGVPEQPKAQIENHLRNSGADYTILRPATFMENILRTKEKLVTEGFREARKADFNQQFIATHDIGFFVAEAFDHPQQWIGRELEIAGDELTQLELAELYGSVLGKPVVYHHITWEETGIPEHYLHVMRWSDTDVVRADIASLRKQYPNLTRYEDFLLEHWGRTSTDSAE